MQRHNNGLGFVDCTFDIATTKPSLRLGFFFFSSYPSTTSQYVQCHRLTPTQLEQHAQSVGLDIYSGPPEAMAKMMAQALLSDTIQAQLDGSTLSCSWEYSDLQDRGTFTNWTVEHISQFDTVATNLLYQNLQPTTTTVTHAKTSANTVAASDEIMVERYLQQCYDDKKQGTVIEAQPVVSTSETRKRPLMQGKYVSVATKSRKKKGKIMYEQQPSELNYNDPTS